MVRKELKGKDQAPCQDFKKKCTIIEQLFFLQKNLQYLQKNHLAAAHNVDELGLSLKR